MVRAWMVIVTHRSFVFDYGTVHAFDTAYPARRFIRNNRDPDLMVIARGKFFFKRQDKMELTIRINAPRCEENATYLDAAQQIAAHIEQEIEIAADMAGEEAPANG
jgi:hypothetical protein